MRDATPTQAASELIALARDVTGVVLLVSFPSDDIEMYAGYFRGQTGLATLEAHTAHEAYAAALKTSPSVVILDVRLSGNEDGLELTRRFKHHPLLRDVPIVVVTGYVADNLRRAAAAAGCDLFVAKPCLPDALLRLITPLMRRSS